MTQSNQCNLCKNGYMFKKCKAYPNGIPDDIYFGEHDHTKPYKGDNGIRFEAIDLKPTKKEQK